MFDKLPQPCDLTFENLLAQVGQLVHFSAALHCTLPGLRDPLLFHHLAQCPVEGAGTQPDTTRTQPFGIFYDAVAVQWLTERQQYVETGL